MGKKFSAGQKLLCRGYTTDFCAAAAAKAATAMLLSGRIQRAVSVLAPDGRQLKLGVRHAEIGAHQAICAVRKDGGVGPGATDGMLVYAAVSTIPAGFEIDGGEGSGHAAKEMLRQPIGAAAIHFAARGLIMRAVIREALETGYDGGLRVVISLPDGRRPAAHTSSPPGGSDGGASATDAGGMAGHMSEKKLADTVRAEVGLLAARGMRALLITPDNYGAEFARDSLGLPLDSNVKCGDHIGYAVDAAIEHGFGKILVLGPVGMLVKLGIGMLNTCPDNGDGRLETLLACAIEAGGGLALLHDIMGSVSADAALALISREKLLVPTMDALKSRITHHLSRRVPPETEIGFFCLASAGKGCGILTKSDNADNLVRLLKNG